MTILMTVIVTFYVVVLDIDILLVIFLRNPSIVMVRHFPSLVEQARVHYLIHPKHNTLAEP